MDIDSAERFVDEAIEKWWTVLAGRILLIKESGRTPVLIALSRKMPRFMEWLRQSFLPSRQDLPEAGVLDGCELTTELSIPFRVTLPGEFSTHSYILLDDIIIHGTTLRSVAADIELLSHVLGVKAECYLSCIFIYRRPTLMPACVSTEDIDGLEQLDLERTKTVVARIAGFLREDNLPLDMEYPILRVTDAHARSGMSVDYVYGHFQSCGPTYSYIGRWGNTATAVFERERQPANSDFAKVRFFLSNNSVSFEIFAPYTLPDFLSRDVSVRIFSNEDYAALWEETVGPVIRFARDHERMFDAVNGEALRRNMSRSLAVWANYLLSLSYLAGECDGIIPPSLENLFDVADSDVDLIIGAGFRKKVVASIRKILKEKTTEHNLLLLNETGGTDWFAPEPLTAEYKLLKAREAARCENAKQVLAGIFQFQNYANPEHEKPQYHHERLFYGETFASLSKACSPYFKGPDTENEINRWVDDQIDNGAVVPKYELFISDEGQRRWRRFFHAGLNSAKA